MLEGVDVSYAQGNYQPGPESFVIVNASRANIGLAVGSRYRQQVANARAAGKHVGHYFFNGNIDPVRCADFFVTNLLYQPGDSLWLDCESEASTGTVAWTPAQAAAFNARVVSHGLPVPGTYLNRSLMDGFDWSQVVAQGAPLWIAYYNPAPPPIKWWPTWTVWQYTSTPIDRNKAQGALVASLAAAPIQEEEDEDVEGFYIQADSAGAKYYFSPSKGNVRPVSSDEWSFLRAVEQTAGGLSSLGRPIQLITVSQGWLDKAIKL
jgi:lysozyme